jgi:hypothetical protein
MYTVRRRLHMDRWVLLVVVIFASIFLPMIIAFFGLGKHWRAAEERARARRIAETKMNARLLRFNI